MGDTVSVCLLRSDDLPGRLIEQSGLDLALLLVFLLRQRAILVVLVVVVGIVEDHLRRRVLRRIPLVARLAALFRPASALPAPPAASSAAAATPLDDPRHGRCVSAEK